MYSSTLSLTSALDGVWWLTPRLGRFTPRKDLVPIVQEAGRAPGPIWPDAENLSPTGIRFPDRPARSEYLYRLRYPASAEHSSEHSAEIKNAWSYNSATLLSHISTQVSAHYICCHLMPYWMALY